MNLFKKIIIFGLLTVFLILNILSGNRYPQPIVDILLSKSENSVVDYLIKVKNYSDYKIRLDYFTNTYNYDFTNDVEGPERKKKESLVQLKAVLAKNNKAVDVLLALSSVYQNLADEDESARYLKQALEIDPTLKISNLK